MFYNLKIAISVVTTGKPKSRTIKPLLKALFKEKDSVIAKATAIIAWYNSYYPNIEWKKSTSFDLKFILAVGGGKGWLNLD